MPTVRTGYTVGPGGYYRDSDNSGPYTIDSAGNASLLSGSGSSGSLPAGTDRSGSITAGNAAQSLAPANASRQSLTGQNISAGDLWINESGSPAAVDTAGSFKVPAGSSFAVATNKAVSIIGATTGQKFTATET